MQSRIDVWAKKGGKKEELWESVKNAEKREGMAVCVDEKVRSELDKKKKKQTKMERERERLQGSLNQVLMMREEIKNSMEILVWREQLLQLASGRAEHIDQCGWDQRLCFGEEEWQDFGAGVLESYDDVKEVKDEDGMQIEEGEEEGEWWCIGQKSCKRHNGYVSNNFTLLIAA
jgi:COMPASS component SPP1